MRSKLKIVVELDDEAIAALQYPVLVTQWHRAVGPGSSARHRNAYQEQFSEKERRIISRYKSRFYRWYLVTGPPQHTSMKATTYALLKRAVAFFAGI